MAKWMEAVMGMVAMPFLVLHDLIRWVKRDD